MARQSSGWFAGLVVMIVMTVGAFVFMFIAWITADYKKQEIASLDAQVKELTEIIESAEIVMEGVDEKKELKGYVKAGLTAALAKAGNDHRDAVENLDEAKQEETTVRGWRDKAKTEADDEHDKIDPEIRALATAIRQRMSRLKDVKTAMEDMRRNFEADKKGLEEDIRVKREELSRNKMKFEGDEKEIDDEISDLQAKLVELRERLEIVRSEVIRKDAISDAGGKIEEVGEEGTNFVVITLGSADRIRKGLKFKVWTLRRGHGVAWVEVKGEDFVRGRVLPGDTLVVGRGDDEQRYHILSVGITREAERGGVGLSEQDGFDTLKIIGTGVADNMSVAGRHWRVEHAENVMSAEEIGVLVKATIEITEVQSHSSYAVILPAGRRNPVCPQCGWGAYKHDMRNCVFCFKGETDDERVPVREAREGVLSKEMDPFMPVLIGDRLSNPYFSPNRPLVFVLGSEPVRKKRHHLKSFIVDKGGKVADPEDLLIRPEVYKAEIKPREVLPWEVNFVIPGKGPDAKSLVKRARDLGIRVMREEDIYDFYGEIY